jgi:large subunit ribosomal protein L29
MNIKEIREQSVQDLAARKHELREESFHLRIQQQSGQLEKPSQLRAIRREIARLETVLNEKNKSKTKAAPAAKK